MALAPEEYRKVCGIYSPPRNQMLTFNGLQRRNEIVEKVSELVKAAFGDSPEDMIEIHGLSTAPEKQGLGYASALMSVVGEMVRCLHVSSSRARTKSYRERAGRRAGTRCVRDHYGCVQVLRGAGVHRSAGGLHWRGQPQVGRTSHRFPHCEQIHVLHHLFWTHVDAAAQVYRAPKALPERGASTLR